MNDIMIKPKDLILTSLNAASRRYLDSSNGDLYGFSLSCGRCGGNIIYWIHNLNYISKSLFVFKGTKEYEYIESILKELETKKDYVGFLKDDGRIEKYCNDIVLKQIIKEKDGIKIIEQILEEQYEKGFENGKREIQNGLKSLLDLPRY
jgi:hypothetical protein